MDCASPYFVHNIRIYQGYRLASYYLSMHAATFARVYFQYHHSRESRVYDRIMWFHFSSVVI